MGSQKDVNETARTTKQRRKRCMIIIFVLGLAILFTIFGLTFFKPKMPETTVNDVSIQDVHTDFPNNKLHINLTLLVDLSIKNPNPLGFKYKQTVAYLRYKDQTIGESPIEEGEIGRNETKNINLKMTLMGDKLLLDLSSYSHARALPLSTDLTLTGSIQLLFKVGVTSKSTCTFNVDALGGALSNLACHYHAKFD